MYTALSDYGWKREDGKLAVEWEVPENIERAKASMEFMLKGCNAKADAQLIIITSNKNFILKYFRCRDGKRTETRIGMEGICITHSCIPLYTVYMQHIMAHSGGMQEWVIQIPSIPILVSVLFPSLHLKYFRIKFLLLVCIVFMRMRTKPHPHPVISEATPTSSYKKGLEVLAVFALVCTFPAFS